MDLEDASFVSICVSFLLSLSLLYIHIIFSGAFHVNRLLNADDFYEMSNFVFSEDSHEMPSLIFSVKKLSFV